MLNGKQLKQSRKLLGLSLEEVAKRMYTTRQTISNIELGNSNHPMTVAFYNRIIEDLIKEEKEEYIEELDGKKYFVKEA
jgi:transcriptional regulator with XRE-family HTH domain